MPFSSEDFRKIARDKLKGHWVLAVIVGLVAGIFTQGTHNVINIKESVGDVSNIAPILEKIPTSLFALIGITGAIAVVLSFVLFLISGAIELGYCQFNL